MVFVLFPDNRKRGVPHALLVPMLDVGTILTAYYYNQEGERITVAGGPRYIGSTRFGPNELLGNGLP